VKLRTLIILAVATALMAPHIYHQSSFKRTLSRKIEADRVDHHGMAEDKHIDLDADQTGFMVGVGMGFVLTEDIIHEHINRLSPPFQARFHTWRWRNRLEVAASAQGLDQTHHFVNSYLVNFAPFVTDKLWVPLYTLALKKKYQYDHLQYSGLADVWQTSRQAYYYSRGDCEDHSLAVADWMISMGREARVVLGDHNGNGHAWVVLFHDSRTYLIEATSKRKIKNLRHYPLASLAKGYHPKFQFDRTHFWVNTGSTFTTRYKGQPWVLRSTFKKSRTS
jgi:hypothetical protein